MTANVPVIKAGGDAYGGAYVRVTPVITVDEAGNYVAPGSGGSSGGSTPTGPAGAPNAAVVTVQGIANGTTLAVADAIADAALGTPADTPWSSGAGTLVALGKAIVGTLRGVVTVTLNGMLPAGTNAIGTVGANQLGQWFESPFLPIPGATSGLTAGPTATTTPLALGTYAASTYRIRNAASSASSVAWRLNTATPGTAAIMPVPASTAGTGGTVGDKTIDPGGVEVFTLTAAQQTALAAGTLYLSAITPAGGSATIYLTPGVAGR